MDIEAFIAASLKVFEGGTTIVRILKSIEFREKKSARGCYKLTGISNT